MPDRHLGTAIAASHNDMMVKRWLEHPEFGDRFRGTIRVDPDDMPGSLRGSTSTRTIPGWCRSGSAAVAQAVRRSPSSGRCGRRPCGAGLPVAAHVEVGAGIAFPPTPSGKTLTYEQYQGFMSLNSIYHVMNMIAEGVFEQLDG